MKKLSLLLVSLLLASTLASCASGGTDAGGNTSAAGGDGAQTSAHATETEPEYVYPNENYKDYEFKALNAELNTWAIKWNLDTEEMTGDVLDDAIYERNRRVEEKLGFKLKEITVNIDKKLTEAIKTAVLAGDDIYDVTYVRADEAGSLISIGAFYNLLDIPEYDFSSPWWEQSVVTEGRFFNDTLYFTCSDLNLYAIEGTWCMFFNQKLMKNYNMAAPYDLVREGKWTMDKLLEYISPVASLNGDASYAWSVDGKAVYGYTAQKAANSSFIAASGERFIKLDSAGSPYFALETERFYSVADKIAKICGKEGQYISINNAKPNHYETVFASGRALFIGGEIKSATVFRDMEDDFGLVPFPKFEESQENYYANIGKAALMLTIPVTNKDTKRTAIITDALSYETYASVMPVYYDVTVSQKGLRNEDSIEMLNLVRNIRYFDTGLAYGWTSTLYETVRTNLDAGDSALASTIASEKEKIGIAIKTTMDKIKSL